MAFRRWSLLAGFVLGAVIVDGCSADAGAPALNSVGCHPRCDSGTPTDGGRDSTLDVGYPDHPPVDDGGMHNWLCGRGCDPDDPRACTDAAPLAVDGGDGVSDASGPDGGRRDSGSTRDAEPSRACQVHRSGPGPAATCGPAGDGKTGEPCVTSADCAPGLACVGDNAAALCRPYCCGGSDGGDGSNDAGASRCGASEYCAQRPLRDDADSAAPLRVPVCVPAERCRLDEPYPCPANLVCSCPAGTACTVVGDDTTGCVEPGTGMLGQSCPCGPGLICSKVTDKCVKLCSTTALANPCGKGVCQSVAGLPNDWGVCVGMMADGG